MQAGNYRRHLNTTGIIIFSYLGFTENVLADGLYVIYMKQYIEVFGEDKVLLVDGNELCKLKNIIGCLEKTTF